MLTVKEIETKSFSKAKVGYSPDEVDNFLDEILEDYDRFAEEIAALEKKIEMLDQTIEELKKQKSSVKITVPQTPANLIENAQTKAEKLVNDAQDYAKKLIEAAKVESENQQQRTARLNKEVADFKSNLLSLYENHVKLISSIPEIKDFSVEESGSLELLKSATTDITEEETKQIPVENSSEVKASVEDDSFGDIIPDVKFEEEDEISDGDFNVVMDVEEEVKPQPQEEPPVKSRRKKIIEEKKSELDEDDEDYIDFEDFDQEDGEESAFGSLFGGKKAKKEKKKKKHHFFNVEDDDDDFDDDFDDDDDF